MTDVEKMLLADETPEADAVEQRVAVDFDDETGLDSAYVDDINECDANEADVVDQAIILPVSEPISDPNVTSVARHISTRASRPRSAPRKTSTDQ